MSDTTLKDIEKISGNASVRLINCINELHLSGEEMDSTINHLINIIEHERMDAALKTCDWLKN